ncbi:hypothetical protein EM20IM_06295 [Candidatus Methylacidiphilum infernorum]|uniref:Uncharacterized protein n=1 Tax=Candidatus Methylacidiphilum infernorum TaxID=511746 RepID=A0ABX7PTX8_9BACT|nr:hypothetical protein [Candidatus Methylacidiphilum infernorum]QSR86118.1 hypothetical protein EM20IM_06295 [Candidatus Methylacidiphilum infernorum]
MGGLLGYLGSAGECGSMGKNLEQQKSCPRVLSSSRFLVRLDVKMVLSPGVN